MNRNVPVCLWPFISFWQNEIFRRITQPTNRPESQKQLEISAQIELSTQNFTFLHALASH